MKEKCNVNPKLPLFVSTCDVALLSVALGQPPVSSVACMT